MRFNHHAVWFGCVLFAFHGVIFATNATQLTATQASDTSPQASVKALFEALAKGDVVNAESLTNSGDLEKKWIRSTAACNVAFVRLGKSAIARFGDAGKVLATPPPAEEFARGLDKSTVEEEGDSAKVHVGPASAPPTLVVRQNGKWKVDLVGTLKGRDARETSATLDNITLLLNSVSDQIDAGKFSSVEEAQAALSKPEANRR